MKEKRASIIGMFTALLASACCLGPALFLAFGITGLGFLTRFERLRPYLLALTFIFAGITYYYVYGKGSTCQSEGECNPRARRVNRVLFWVLAAFTVFGVSFPYLLAWIFNM